MEQWLLKFVDQPPERQPNHSVREARFIPSPANWLASLHTQRSWLLDADMEVEELYIESAQRGDVNLTSCNAIDANTRILR